ncbi:hypothetical protein M758_4G261000 [Ceratodon purpureus]|uniref:Uncharacterized protein n=1 Tax=Ceratodon purpureus TaxID=3225 RepID=A0A8T0IF33_CERPU|nr:hypothetical protein KC19_4G255900 [Ceratodon purpureus]KAG0621001.1 hypothetical protein M758_4G261000 [Ceratodon purpureus]
MSESLHIILELVSYKKHSSGLHPELLNTFQRSVAQSSPKRCHHSCNACFVRGMVLSLSTG